AAPGVEVDHARVRQPASVFEHVEECPSHQARGRTRAATRRNPEPPTVGASRDDPERHDRWPLRLYRLREDPGNRRHFFCCMSAPQQRSVPLPALVTITCEPQTPQM